LQSTEIDADTRIQNVLRAKRSGDVGQVSSLDLNTNSIVIPAVEELSGKYLKSISEVGGMPKLATDFKKRDGKSRNYQKLSQSNT
jgi:hypothetical protein